MRKPWTAEQLYVLAFLFAFPSMGFKISWPFACMVIGAGLALGTLIYSTWGGNKQNKTWREQ